MGCVFFYKLFFFGSYFRSTSWAIFSKSFAFTLFVFPLFCQFAKAFPITKLAKRAPLRSGCKPYDKQTIVTKNERRKV